MKTLRQRQERISALLPKKESTPTAGYKSRTISFGGGNRWVAASLLTGLLTLILSGGSALSQTQSFDSFGGAANGGITGTLDPFWGFMDIPFARNNDPVSDTAQLNSASLAARQRWFLADFHASGFAVSDSTVVASGTYTLSYNFPLLSGTTASFTP